MGKLKKALKKVAKLTPIGMIASAASGGKKKETPAPMPETPVMPLPDDDAAKKARRRSLLAASRRSGRDSTVLTSKLG